MKFEIKLLEIMLKIMRVILMKKFFLLLVIIYKIYCWYYCFFFDENLILFLLLFLLLLKREWVCFLILVVVLLIFKLKCIVSVFDWWNLGYVVLLGCKGVWESEYSVFRIYIFNGSKFLFLIRIYKVENF